MLKRQLAKRNYVDPEELMTPVKDAAGNYTERFQAGFVAYMVQRFGRSAGRVRVSFGEIQDADAVLMLDDPKMQLAGETPAFRLIQLKEFHPRCSRSFQEFLNELKWKYPKSPDLILAIHLNQDTKLSLPELDFVGFGVAAIYLLGGNGDEEMIHGSVVADWIDGVVWEGRIMNGNKSLRHLRFKPSRVPKRVQIALGILLVAFAGVVAWQMLGEREPVYKGKPLSAWLEGYTIPKNEAAWRQTDEAVRHIGAKAIPSLLHMLRLTDSARWKQKLLGLAYKQHFVKVHHINAWGQNWRAPIPRWQLLQLPLTVPASSTMPLRSLLRPERRVWLSLPCR